jgi:hypothetical protein
MKLSARVQQVIAAFRALCTTDQDAFLRRLDLVRRSLANDAPADIDIDKAVSEVDWLAELAPGPGERNIAEPWRPLNRDKVVEPGAATSQVRNRREK